LLARTSSFLYNSAACLNLNGRQLSACLYISGYTEAHQAVGCWLPTLQTNQAGVAPPCNRGTHVFDFFNRLLYSEQGLAPKQKIVLVGASLWSLCLKQRVMFRTTAHLQP